MVEVTEADRIAAAAYMKLVGSQRWSQQGIFSGGCDNTSIVQAFATHREAAAKAAILGATEKAACLATIYKRGDIAEQIRELGRREVAALADALEGKP